VRDRQNGAGLPLDEPVDTHAALWGSPNTGPDVSCVHALRAEVERLEHMMETHYVAKPFVNTLEKQAADMDEELSDLRSQLSARDAEVLALRGFAEAMNRGMRGRYAQVLKSRAWIKRQMTRHGLMEEDGKHTPLLTGEPGPGGEG
jgi:hypothetical protein